MHFVKDEIVYPLLSFQIIFNKVLELLSAKVVFLNSVFVTARWRNEAGMLKSMQ